jgi:hypothetical protein
MGWGLRDFRASLDLSGLNDSLSNDHGFLLHL